jgi:hypothetical protein
MCAQMALRAARYLRFTSARPLEWAPADAGIFGPAYFVRDSAAAPAWLRDSVAREIDWFCEHLDAPTRKSRRAFAGVCWFRPEARACIGHAHALAALLRESDIAIGVLETDDPGEIVYRDRAQIVAMPRRSAPPRYAG